jgi:predicted metal-binding membrane protein
MQHSRRYQHQRGVSSRQDLMADDNGNFDHLDRAGQATATIARQPRLAVHIVIGLAVALSWIVLLTMSVRNATMAPGSSGPGGSLLELLPLPPLPTLVEQFLQLCLTPAAVDASTGQNFAALSLMWFLMALAMMLPSAAPMIRTYCEIADTARAKGEPFVHPFVLVAGYLSVWFCASLIFAGLTLALQKGPDGLEALAPARGLAGAAALMVAGLYQFTGLKQACLEKCRNPFTILFSRWSSAPASIFRLGVDQGIWCLGCCWALMLVMFAVGLMNIFWMVLIALFTIVEKQVAGKVLARAAGAILLVWAAALLVVSA